MERRLTQITALAVDDGLRKYLALYALDDEGRLWVTDGQTWTVAGNPPFDGQGVKLPLKPIER